MSCCFVWRVNWTENEVQKLKNADCSDSLRAIIDNSFFKKDDIYVIVMDDKFRCPFLTEDNFCRIQKELGEEYLSHTCRIYPRQSIVSGNYVINCCNLSCYRVMDFLCNDKDCMKLENHAINGGKFLEGVYADSKVDMINHPELKFRHQLFEFFYEIISDDSYSIETSLILGALAAQKLTEFINKGRCDLIPEIINSIKPQLKNKAQIHNIDEIKPNQGLKIKFAVELHKIIMNSDLLDGISENGIIDDEKYNEGVRKFSEAFADRPFAMRNIALNLWLEMKMPFKDKVLDLFSNYCYYVSALAAIKLVGAAVFASNDDPEQAFKSLSAYVSRSFSHSSKKIRTVSELLKKYNCTSPAYLALIIK